MISTQLMKKDQIAPTPEHYKLVAYFGGQSKSTNYYGEFTKNYLNQVGGMFTDPVKALVHKIKEILPYTMTLIIYDNFAEIPPMPAEFKGKITPGKWTADHQIVLKIVKRKVIVNKLPKEPDYKWIPKMGEVIN